MDDMEILEELCELQDVYINPNCTDTEREKAIEDQY
jgi:hypothetical protein